MIDFWASAEMGYMARSAYLEELIETGNLTANDLTQNEREYVINEYYKRSKNYD